MVNNSSSQPYITMAFIQGRPLRDFTQSKRTQPQRQAAAVVRKIALGLAEAHAHGVIHRDLKPASIMIDAKGDFAAATAKAGRGVLKNWIAQIC
jgi:serine/threonine-protein kinase